VGKKQITLLIIAGAIVAYLLIRPKPAAAAPVQQPIASAPASPPPADLGTQIANIGAQVTAGLGAINTASATIPTIVPTITTAATQATAAAAAIPGQVGAVVTQVGTAATQLGTAVGTAANTVVGGVATYLPYLGPFAALSIIGFGIAQTHRTYDTGKRECCDTNALGMRFNCRWDWSIMECIYEVYDYASWPREKKVNMIFAELEQWRGKVQAGSVAQRVRRGGYDGGYTNVTHYTSIGLTVRPNLATDAAPGEFRILNPDEIVKYRAIKADIIAYNRTLVKSQPVRIDAIRNYVYSPNYGYRIPGPGGRGWVYSRTLPDSLRYITLGNASTSEFNINWLY